MTEIIRKKRARRRDEEVDSTRTIFWFRSLGESLGTHEPREIQRAIAPNTLGVDSVGNPIRNSKFLGYARGEHVPLDWLVQQAEQIVPRSAWGLNHPLWRVLRTSSPINRLALKWVRELDPDIQHIVLSQGVISTSANRHTRGTLERRASLDSLAALTILMRLNHEQGGTEAAWDFANSIFRVLLMLGPMFERHIVADCVFLIYVARVFSQVEFAGQRMALENYDYSTRSLLLDMLAAEMREHYEPKRERRLPSFYALQILDGKCQLRFRKMFLIPTGPSNQAST